MFYAETALRAVQIRRYSRLIQVMYQGKLMSRWANDPRLFQPPESRIEQAYLVERA